MYALRSARQPDAPAAVSPHELNSEMAALLAQHNGGLDRENVTSGTIALDDVADDAMQQLARDSTTVDQVVALPVQAHVGAILPVPDASGDPWSVEINAEEDAMVRVSLSGSVQNLTLLHLYLEVDGLVVARLDAAGGGLTLFDGSFDLDAVFPVSAGTHILEVKFGAALSSGGTSTFNDRTLIIDRLYR